MNPYVALALGFISSALTYHVVLVWAGRPGILDRLAADADRDAEVRGIRPAPVLYDGGDDDGGEAA